MLSFIGKNDQFFLNIAMAMGKAMTDPAQNIEASTIVTAMCRNGTDFGIRMSGTGDRWFTAPVEMPVGLYFPGYSRRGRQPGHGRFRDRRNRRPRRLCDGDAPAVVGFVGAGSASDAPLHQRDVRDHDQPQHRVDDSQARLAGVPAGIDIRKVLQPAPRR